MKNNKSNSKLFNRLKLNSWEVEILIVGFLLMSLLQFPDYLINQLSDLRLQLDTTSDQLIFRNVSTILVFLSLLLSTRIIIINLTIYVVLRSFWVGLLGLSYVFPKGIKIEQLNYHDFFINNLKTYDLENNINKIDKLCSSIFSFLFLVTLTTMSIIILLIEMVLLMHFVVYIFGSNALLEDTIAFIWLFFGGLYFFDLLSFGLLKKIKWKPIALPYYYIYNLFNYLSLGFIYNNLYYIYISNIKARYIIIPTFLLFSFISFNNFDNRYDFFSTGTTENISSYKFYEDEFNQFTTKTSKAPIPFIQSKIIRGNYLDLHIPYKADINSGLENLCLAIKNIDEINRSDSTKYFIPKVIDCVNKFYNISINNLNYKSDFIAKIYSNEFVTYTTFNMVIPLNTIEKGKHIINITAPDTAITKLPDLIEYTIPFFITE